MKQRVIIADSLRYMDSQLDTALRDGWLIQQVVVNSDSNNWLAVVYKEDSK